MTTPRFIQPLETPAERDRLIELTRGDVPAWTPLPDGRGDPVYHALENTAEYAREKVDDLNAGGLQTLLEYATGEYLELIGAITNRPRRSGEGDEVYRLEIPRPLLSRSSGTPDYIDEKSRQAGDYMFDVSDDALPGVDQVNVWLIAHTDGEPRPPTADEVNGLQAALRRSDTQEVWVVYTVMAGVVKDFRVDALITIDGDQGLLDIEVRRELADYFRRVRRLNRSVNVPGLSDALIEHLLPHSVLNVRLKTDDGALPNGRTDYPLPAAKNTLYRGSVGTLLYHQLDVPTFGFNRPDPPLLYRLLIPTAGHVGEHIPIVTLPEAQVGAASYALQGGPGAVDNQLKPDEMVWDPANRTLRYLVAAGGRNAFTSNYFYYAVSADGVRSPAIEFTIDAAVQAIFQTQPTDVAWSMGDAAIDVTLPALDGDPAGVTYAASPLPDGLAFDGARRELTGTPTENGVTTVSYSAAGSGLVTVTADFTITVTGF